MDTFDSLLQRAKEVAFASLSLPEDTSEEIDFDDEVLIEVGTAIEAFLPAAEDLDAQWVATMIAARPAMLMRETSALRIADGLRIAIADQLVDELEDALREHILSRGYSLPAPPAWRR